MEKREKLNRLKTNNISDSKRQQTTTVDYKRLINGLVLTSVVTLHRQILRQKGRHNKLNLFINY